MPETYSITLKHDNGIDCLAPRTTASNVTMADGRTTEVVINEKADKDLLQLKTANFKLPSDLPNSYPNGFSAFYGSAAEWGIGAIGANYGVIVETFKFSNGYSRQTISSISTLPLKYRASGTNNVWGEWKSITTSADLELKADYPKKGRYTGDLFAISGDFYKTYDVGLLSTVINYPPTANAYAALEYIPIAATIAKLRWTTYGSNPRTTYECTYNPTTKTALIDWKEIAATDKIDISSNLRNGWSASSLPVILTIGGKTATIVGSISGGTITKNTNILSLPTGITPTASIIIAGAFEHSSPAVARTIRVNASDTNIKIDNNYDWVTGKIYLLNFSFPIN